MTYLTHCVSIIWCTTTYLFLILFSILVNAKLFFQTELLDLNYTVSALLTHCSLLSSADSYIISRELTGTTSVTPSGHLSNRLANISSIQSMHPAFVQKTKPTVTSNFTYRLMLCLPAALAVCFWIRATEWILYAQLMFFEPICESKIFPVVCLHISWRYKKHLWFTT